MGWNLPDGVTPAMIDALYVDEEAWDRIVREIADDLINCARADGLNINFDEVSDYGILDDDFREQIVEAIRTHPADFDGYLRDIVDEAADENLDLDAALYDRYA